jgi:hypothetical protein
MSLALDYLTIQKTQRQQIIDLLDQLRSISAALRTVREQKKSLFAQRQLLCEKRPTFCEQLEASFLEESMLLQEYRTILTELAFLREQKY